jgi:tetratricopeptide (TPR) repeat protein
MRARWSNPVVLVRIFAAATLLCLSAPCPAQPSTGAPSLTLQAQRRAVEGDLAGARIRLVQALRLDPTYGPAWIELGSAHEREGDNVEALRVYQACIDRTPGYAEVFRARAKLLERLGRLQDAWLDLRAAVGLTPGDTGLRSECVGFFVRRAAWSAALQQNRAMQVIFEAKGDRTAAAQARVRTLALSVLAQESDPVTAGAQRRGWERRAIASIGRRLGSL